ncbi:hypothetical protein F4804DRAFT_343115 [Jackrogersella minutella]|nr:hypothetical protein F4804DRAFT_343115 [Jackrogersella minutella]
MNRTKDTIKDFINKASHHDTTIHKSIEPAVKHETVKPTNHEYISTTVDKETHQDHYHRSVQPVQDREVLPEQHKYKVGNIQHREYDHRDHANTQKVLAAEDDQWKDKRTVQDTVHTHSHAPTLQGENIHHHIHETVQPVLHKETIQPHVVHTTLPIHETHHNHATHHATTSLPPVSMYEYKKQSNNVSKHPKEHGGVFEGEPTSIRGILSIMHDKNDSGKHDSGSSFRSSPTGVFHGEFDSSDEGRDQQESDRSQKEKAVSMNADPVTSSFPPNAHPAPAKRDSSLFDKINPLTNSSGHGKPGFMR